MRRVFNTFILIFMIHASCFGQSYVDSGIQHYLKEEYKEALVDFEEGLGLKEMLTQSAVGKMHYYMGMTWLSLAESGKTVNGKDATLEAYQNLRIVSDYSSEWSEPVSKAYTKISQVLVERAEGLLKDLRKADDLEASLAVMDEIISHWKIIVEMDVTYGGKLELARANKAAGDLIFESSTDFKLMMRAKEYYETALPLYEEARYDDPFSKDIISDLLTLAQRLADQERIEEYEKLLDLAGG